MLQYYRIILGLIYDSLKWTGTKNSFGKQKPYCNLRIASYKSLSFWCNSMKFGSCVEIIADDVFKQIDFDITAFQNELTLQVLSGAKKHMSKKARRQLHKTQNEASNLNQKHSSSQSGSKVVFSDEGNQSLCAAALNCLRDILFSSSCFLKPTLIKDIQDRAMTIALSLPKSYGEREKLYSSHITRKSFYEVLETIIIANNHLCPPPTQLILKFISAGSTEDPNEGIRGVCLNLLRRLEKVIHPQKDCLYFPPNIKEIENVFSKYGRTLGSNKQEDEESSDEEVESDDDEVLEQDCDKVDKNNDDGDDGNEEEEGNEEEKVDNGKDEKEDALQKPGRSIDLTEEKIVAMEVIESSDESDCVVTEEVKEVEESEDEPEPMLRLVVESDDENEKDSNPSTSEEPVSKKLRIEVTQPTEEEDNKLLEDITSAFVDELCPDSE